MSDKTYTYEYDEDSFVETALALKILNPEYAGGYETEDLIRKMKYDHTLERPGYWGTLGFYVVGCESPKGSNNMFCKAVLSSYTVGKYLEKLKDLTPKGCNLGDYGMFTTSGNAKVEKMIRAVLKMSLTTSPAELSKVIRTKMAGIAKTDGEVYDTVVRDNICKVLAKHTYRDMNDFNI